MRILAPSAFVLASLLVAACTSGGGGGGTASPTPTATPTNVTFWENVAPILTENCAACHIAGGIAPFPLLTYTDALPYALSIKAETAARRMPPSTVDVSGACNSFSDAKYLTDFEIATLASWADNGQPEGNPASAPPAPTPLPTMAAPDATLDIGLDYTPPAAPSDEYRCFVADPGIAGTQYLTGYEVKPGNRAIVHHVVVYTLTDAQAQTEAEGLDAADAAPGYLCFGGSGVSSSIAVAWAPGTGATYFAPGTGISMPAGRKAVIQLHYNVLAGTGVDRTTIALKLAPSVTKQAFIAGAADTSFTLQPGLTDTVVTTDQNVPVGGLIHAIYPHMHKLGTTLKLERIRGGNSTCVVDVPRWNFAWQEFHDYTTPVDVQAGDTLRLTCHYNTSGETNPVSQGEGTQEEMCGVGFYATGP